MMTVFKRVCRAMLVPMLALSAITPAAAQVQLLGDFNRWSSYSASEGGNAICFALTRPSETNPTPDGYGDAYIYLTNRPAENARAEFNLIAGYTFAPDTEATLSVGGQSFALFTQNDAAWLLDQSQTETLAGVMRAGSSVVVEGTSERGIRVRQTFSLSGATAASRAIDQQCG
ncbi:hypothetical protein EMQ25_14760 [Arsenicitalea aurantiaca]|uniref:Invasion associated locus B family protein n=1 Tax=Arsenicitalea aurantiaca TaxID=1783274 RepID=A0A433X5Q3_9HYPH|nr:invasion associated locus B family protein [Arsenicitalea aurantiaca]RUT29378.1 hypothetical protein EMQ25_14760 [Arsenicitalea aurantiaca]